MPIDWTHIGLLISCSALLVPVKRSAFLDMRPIAVDQLLEQMSDAILVIDKRLRVVDCNRAALANLGLMQAPLGHTLPGGSRRWERRTTHQALAGFSSGVI